MRRITNTLREMRKILTLLFALVALAGQAQKQVVWEKPTAFMGHSNGEFEITKVELKQTETAWLLDSVCQRVVRADT